MVTNLSITLKNSLESMWYKSKWLVITIVGLFLVLIIGSNIGTDIQATERPNLTASQSQAVDTLFEEPKYSEALEIEKSPSGKPVLKGYIDEIDSFEALKEKFNSLSADIIFDVKNTTELASQAQEILHAMDFDKVKLVPMEDGKIVAKGYINDSTSWIKTKTLIKQDVKGISSIEDDEIKNQETFVRYLRMVAKKLSLDSRLDININKSSDSIEVSGDLTEEDFNNWRQIKDGFKQRYNDLIQIDDRVTIKKRSMLKLAIKSVSIGDVSYVKLKDNNKYMIGSVIDGGYKIEDIQPSKLVLSKNKRKFDYLIGEGNSYE